MTAPPPVPAVSTAASPDARALWRRGRGPLLAVAVLLLTAVALAVFSSGDSRALDPRSTAPHGSRALAELLDDRGVATTVVHTADEAAAQLRSGGTLLVAGPNAVPPNRLGDLHQQVVDAGGRVVMIAPDEAALAETLPHARVAGTAETTEARPECATDLARRAGSATLGGYLYDVPETGADITEVSRCYPVDGLPALVTVDHTEGETVVLGASAPLLNDHLADHGNASLALHLLGGDSDLVWYLPSPSDAPAADEEQGLFGLLDDGWRWAALQLGIAALLAAAWRARRLGPLVTERLPVRIRAAETTEGRARLYHRAGARDRAAATLRAASRERLARALGVSPPTTTPVGQAPDRHPAGAAGPEDDGSALTEAVAGRTGEPPPAVYTLLYGPAPQDDPALVRLADELDALERRIRPPSPGDGPSAPDDAPPTKDSSP